MKRYTVIYEPGKRNWSAYVPDLPGCITTGRTLDETRDRMHEAIAGHIAVMREFGDPIPASTTLAERMQVPA